MAKNGSRFTSRFTFALLFFFSITNCTYRYKYIKKYTINKKYKAYPSETMLSFRYVKFKQLDSGLTHIVRTIRKTTIVYSQIKHDRLVVTIRNEDLSGNYQEKITTKQVILKKSRNGRRKQGKLQLFDSSLVIKIQLEKNNAIIYKIIKESSLMVSQPTIFQQDEIWTQKSIRSKKSKGLKY